MNPGALRVVVVLGSIPMYGLELSLIDVGVMLRDAGAEVLFVTNAHWGQVAVHPRLDALGLRHEHVVFFGSVERGLSFRRAAALLRLQVSENLRLCAILRRFRPTHLHLGTHWDYFNLLPTLRWWPAPLLFHAGNLPDVRHPALRLLWRSLLRRASVLVTVSGFLDARFRELGLMARKAAVVYNRVPQRPPVVQDASPPPRAARTVFLFVGQIAAFKGTDHVVDAAAQLLAEGHDIECWFLGSMASDWASGLRDRVESAGLSTRLRFAGYVADPTPWFSAADVHLMPSLCDEAFGIAVAEAKAAGRPTVAYADGALPELVVHEVDGMLCERGNCAALASAMRRYADQPQLRARHGLAARASLTRLGIDRVGETWATLYRSIR